jgi:predicted MFS family arabinose efflux permease
MTRTCCIGLVMIFLLQMAVNCFTPIWSLYTASIGGDLRSAGIAILIFTWGTALIAAISPLINKKLNIPEQTLLIVGIILNIISVIAYFYVDNIYTFYAVQGLLTLGAGIQIPAFYVIYEKNISRNEKGFAWGALDASFYFAVGLGSILSAFIFYHLTIYAVFTLMLVLVIISLFLALWFIATSSPPQKPGGENP